MSGSVGMPAGTPMASQPGLTPQQIQLLALRQKQAQAARGVPGQYAFQNPNQAAAFQQGPGAYGGGPQ